MSVAAVLALALIAGLGIATLLRPGWHRIGAVVLGSVGLLSVCVLAYMGPRFALARYTAAGGAYSNELAAFLSSVFQVGLVFYSLIALCLLFLGLLVFRLTRRVQGGEV
jgi:hypothetical protein